MTRMNGRRALVLGATGGIGGAAADRLARDGWSVRAMSRNPPAGGRLDWVRGDALAPEDVLRAAEGCDLIVHAVNPPAYRNWAGLQMPMLRSTIAAAKAVRARILFPGTIYNYGPDAFPSLTEDAPQRPTTRKGAIRVEMEAALRQAAGEGAPVLIVRAGDFFGPRPGNNWLSQGLVTPGAPLTRVTYPGPLDLRHAWAFLPDVAEAMVRLARRDDLADFEVFHLRGHEITGEELIAALARATGREPAVRRLPWWALRAAAPFNETVREMLEMRYLWEAPVVLDNSRLVGRLGVEPHTPLDEALRAALSGLRVPITDELATAA